MSRPIIIVANRKMNADKASLEAWKTAVQAVDLPKGVKLIAALPYPYLDKGLLPAGVALAGQDCHGKAAGAFTGSVSAPMLKDVGVEYVIVGHSERRALGEANADVRQKAEAVLANGMKPIICVGEDLPTRESGNAEVYVAKQLEASLPMADDVIIAYEPIWAIGTGKSASSDDAEAMHKALRKVVGDGVPILYGGSVEATNASSYMRKENIDGVLVGSASLKPDSFLAIVSGAE